MDGTAPKPHFWNRFLLGERGASLVEYALLVALIAVVSIGSLTLVGEKTLHDYECVTIEIEHPGIRQSVIDKMKNNVALNNLETKVSEICL
jgi:Flp pilus assembly pilin Flp